MTSLRRRGTASAPAVADGVPHLVFRVAAEEYALRLTGVREIVGLEAVEPMPHAPLAMRGVIQLRGERIAVVDLATALGGARGPDSPESCALDRAALVVDGVSGVSSLAPGQMAPAPRLGSLIEAGLVAAVARADERLLPILDVEHLLASPDIRAARQAAWSPAPDGSSA